MIGRVPLKKRSPMIDSDAQQKALAQTEQTVQETEEQTSTQVSQDEGTTTSDEEEKADNFELFQACKENDLERLKKCELSQINMSDSSSGETPAYVAAANGHFEVLAYLTKSGADLNWPGDNGLTPAQGAALGNYVKCFEWCYNNGSDIDYTGVHGQSCLDIATQENHIDIIAACQILNKPRIQSAWSHDELKRLLESARDGRVDQLKRIIGRGAPIECTPNGFQTPLFQAAACGNFTCVEFLLENGAEVNRTDADKFTAAHVAAQHGRLEVLKLLTAYGAKLEMENPQHMTCVRLARRGRHDKCAEWLQEALSLSPVARQALLNFGEFEPDQKYEKLKLQKHEKLFFMKFKARESRYKGHDRDINWGIVPGAWDMSITFGARDWKVTVESPYGQAAKLGVKSGMKVVAVNKITVTKQNRKILKELLSGRCSVPVVFRFRDTLPLHRQITWFCLALFVAFAIVCEYLMWERIDWKSSLVAEHDSEARCWSQYLAAEQYPSENILYQHCSCFLQSCGCTEPTPFYNCTNTITTSPSGDCIVQEKLDNLDCSPRVISMTSGFNLKIVGAFVTVLNFIITCILLVVTYNVNIIIYRGVEVLRGLQTFVAACAGIHWLLCVVAITEAYIPDLADLGEFQVFQSAISHDTSMTLSINFIITVCFMFIALILGTLIINGLIDQDAYHYRYRQLALFLFGTPPIICFFCVTISINQIKADHLTFLFVLGLPPCGFLIFFSLSSIFEWLYYEHIAQLEEENESDEMDETEGWEWVQPTPTYDELPAIDEELLKYERQYSDCLEEAVE